MIFVGNVCTYSQAAHWRDLVLENIMIIMMIMMIYLAVPVAEEGVAYVLRQTVGLVRV
jgi:hypothetical protein